MRGVRWENNVGGGRLWYKMWQMSFEGAKCQKGQFEPLLSIYANISETVHAVTNVCMKHIIQSHI